MTFLHVYWAAKWNQIISKDTQTLHKHQFNVMDMVGKSAHVGFLMGTMRCCHNT